MQIPIISHRGQKKPWNSIPRINWSHPLAAGLISYGYDVGCGPIDLVTGGLRTITNSTNPPFGGPQTSRYGRGFTCVATTGVGSSPYTVSGGANLENVGVAAPYSFATGLMFTATPAVGAAGLFVNCDATSNRTFQVGCASVSGTDLWWIFSNGGGLSVTAAGAIKINTFQTALGVALTGSTAACYVDGVLNISPAVTTTSAVISGAKLSYWGLRSSGNQNTVSGFNYYGAVWKGRALTAKEARKLHDDPYCFLIYPEDEMFAENVGVTTVFPIIPSSEFQPLQTKVVTYG